jgi:hypothetical protein
LNRTALNLLSLLTGAAGAAAVLAKSSAAVERRAAGTARSEFEDVVSRAAEDLPPASVDAVVNDVEGSVVLVLTLAPADANAVDRAAQTRGMSVDAFTVQALATLDFLTRAEAKGHGLFLRMGYGRYREVRIPKATELDLG